MEFYPFVPLSEMKELNDCMGIYNTSNVSNSFNVSNECGSDYNLRTPLSEGTTIIGVLYKDGVMLACDSRTSSGNFVSHKTARKINRINENIYVCRCGASSDSQRLIEVVKYLCDVTKGENRKRGRPRLKEQTEEEIRRREQAERGTEEEIDLNKINNMPDNTNLIMQNKYYYIDKHMEYNPLVKQAAHFARTIMYDYKDVFSCAFIVGGYDGVGKQQLYCSYVNGSTFKRDAFIALGSGSVFVQSYLQANYKKDMRKKECFDLILNCVRYAIYNDNKSGGIIRIVNIMKDCAEEYTITNTKLDFKF